ncbi:MAG: hypothetical protein HY288_13185 [Planctomycetia bacterium]|nr:hypothetical protein [Planctomycetia bacterium]
MFRPLLLAGCALTLAMLMASSASAQFFGRGMRVPPSVRNIMMLRSDAVKKELDLSADQQKSLDEIAAQMQSEAMEIISGLQDLTPEEREKELPSLLKTMTEKGKELQAQVDKVLNAKQLTRMKELSIQQRGPEAFEDEEVATALKLSDDQKKKLVAVRDEAADKQQEIIKALTSGEGGGDRAAIGEKMQALRKELGDKALAVLTAEQREIFEKMKGAKFDFPQGGRRPF